MLILVPVSLREAGPCTVRRQKQQPACPFRARRHRGLLGPTNRPETIVSRHWWIATQPSTPATIARRSHPRRNVAPTIPRPLRTADDRVTPRPPTRQREPIRTTSPPNNVPTPTPMPTPAPMPMLARTPMRQSVPARNPILRKQTTRNQPQSHLPKIIRQPIPKPTRRNRTARRRRRRTRSRL